MSRKHKKNKHHQSGNKHFHKTPKKNHGERWRRTGKTGEPKQYQHQNQLQEVDVGITQFISNTDGYSGIIKARYSDFQVNEVNLDGEVAKLTDLSIPADFTKNETDTKIAEVDTSPICEIPQTTWEEIKSMLESSTETNVELDVTNLSKESRTRIHECIKKAFGNKIYANTVTNGDKKNMIFKKHDGKSGDARFKWPSDKGEYVHFLVYKECVDTLEACLKIASCLKMPPSSITYAGVKDKRAKTTQWFSVRKVEPWKLIVKTRHLPNIKVGNLVFKDKPIKLGHLQGNVFRIALRNVTGNDELIAESLDHIKTNGFINYYGLQRFGNDKQVPTFSIGLQLLLGNWKEACNLILKPLDSDDPEYEVSKAKKIFFSSGDATKALEEFHGNRNSSIEYLLLTGLGREHSNDFVNALTNIPRNTRLLYIHSFQSLIWNLAASERIKKFGLQVVEGDLVFLKEHESTSEDDSSDNNQVKVLTSEECNCYTIYDIVLPLPGYDINYPNNLIDFYKETLEKYGLSLEMPKQKVKTYTLSGSYRKLLGQVKNLKWKIMRYNEPDHNLIRSDLEELRGCDEPKEDVDGKFKALVLEFFLNSSSYATMVLREILKTDTATSSHAKLNNYHVVSQEQTTEASGASKNEENVDVIEETGLLADAEKYEEFKKAVFDGKEEVSLKRKHEEIN